MGRLAALLLGAVLLASPSVAELDAQEPLRLRLEGSEGATMTVPVEAHRGYAAVSAATLEQVGWRRALAGGTLRLALRDRAEVEVTAGTPFFRWDGELFQLTEAPYVFGERVYLPLQIVSGFLPRRLADAYDYDADRRVLAVRDPDLWRPDTRADAPGARGSAAGNGSERPDGGEAARSGNGDGPSRTRLVVIDAGHGGKDPGARGPGGVLEKDVALGVAWALARRLREDPGIEVHMTRDSDAFVPIWERGEEATRIKGDRPGVFVSLHANAVARSRSVRGFETYFLSEARTEHERRLAALENAPLDMDDGDDGAGGGEDPDLDFILQDLRNSDHTHWSAELAEMVQGELAPVHPGPNRGVKQAPLAVITNALMPGVVVEMGFITNPAEARLLSRASFQEHAARALARALRAFFERYPPGEDRTAGGRR